MRGALAAMLLAGVALACATWTSCDATARPALHLEDVTGTIGVGVTVVSGRAPSSEILEVKGGGVALIDFDSDGDLDVFVPNGATLDDPESGPGARLLENLGGLRFRDATEAAGIRLRRWSFGVAVGDADGDGLDDLAIACFGPDVLLRNAGGRFEDVSADAGIGSPAWGTSCAFVDIDSDGDLDLYTTNFVEFDPRRPPPRGRYMGVEVMAGPAGLAPVHDVLLENLGDGRFRDVSESSGCRAVPPSTGLNVVTLDIDGDGRQDIFVANDSMPNFLFRNLGGGRFEEIGARAGLALNADGAAQASMGIAVGDVDGNGLADFFTTNFSSDTNTLHVNLDGATFEDRTAPYGLGIASGPFVGWASAFADLDHDGDEDLLVFNGHVYPEAASGLLDAEYEERPLLFERRGPRFELARPGSAGAWLGARYRARSAALGDLDGDGDVDVVFTELNGPLHVLRNDAASRAGSAWLIVDLEDRTGGNRRGIGSRVTLIAGERRQTRWIHGGGPFQSASWQAAHFAVPNPPAEATIEIAWPDGKPQSARVTGWNSRMTVSR